jgi:2,4-dienoyl-CoA reductase-like NADH-dependent reductase (Old Yellow Enzyme family)
MHDKYPNVFSPITIGSVEIPNRIYLTPHGVAAMMVTRGDHGQLIPSEDLAWYYGERAAGGVGLLFHSLPLSPRDRFATPFFADSAPDYAGVAAAVHEHGAKIFGQLWYAWMSYGNWEPWGPPAPTVGAGPYQMFETYHGVHEVGRDEIRGWLDTYARGARTLADAGYDGIEIHASHGVLVEHFLSPAYNRRTDEYGGSLENRMRFLLEAIEAVRRAAPGLPVGLRFNCDQMLPGGFTADDAKEMLAILAERGLVDFVDLDIGFEPNQIVLMTTPYFVPPLHIASFVRDVREAVGDVPVLSAPGQVHSVEMAEQVIASGICDAVGAARGLIAEPRMVANARDGLERLSRECIACNVCVTGALEAFGCPLNPETGRERRWGPRATAEPAVEPRRVVVVGGGPAGAEAARVAARRGHDVVLLEARDRIGGQLNAWGRLPDRRVGSVVDWYERVLDAAGVEVRTGVEASAEAVLAERPDAVVVATGGRYAATGESGFIPHPIPGWDLPHVHAPEAILEDGVRPAGRVVILDEEGINTAAGIAEVLAGAGADVILATRWFNATPNLLMTLEMPFIVPRLNNAGVQLRPETYIRSIGERTVTTFNIFRMVDEVIEDVDAVVLATMRKPQDALHRALEGRVEQLFLVGDAAAARTLVAATHEAHRFARLIGVPGAPTTFAQAYFAPYDDDAFPARAAAYGGPGARVGVA